MTTELTGPLQPVRYASGPVEWHDLPRSTLDIRYDACAGHHLACDCREALQAEDISEWRGMYRELEQAILDAIRGHQTYAYTGQPGWPSEGGWSAEDEFGQCKCQACGIARAARIGFGECMRQRLAADGQAKASAEAREQAARNRQVHEEES